MRTTRLSESANLREMKALPRVAVVDDADHFVRWAERPEVHRDRLVHRSVHILVVDSVGRLVIQLRHRDKLTYPLHWDISCSGHVEEPDYLRGPDDDLDLVYEGCAGRELEEELGIRAELTYLAHFGPEPGVHYEQIHLFRASSDGPFTAQAEEIEALRSVTPAELDAITEPCTGSLRQITSIARARGWW